VPAAPAVAPPKTDVATPPKADAKLDATPAPVAPPLVPPAEKTAPKDGIPGALPSFSPDLHASAEPTAADTGILTVWVPNEAKVTINGMLTKSTGSKRRFVSYGLNSGYTYKYVVKAEIVREGKVIKEEQTVSLSAGERGGVAFGFNIPETVAQNE
jgi:uncharacterized protein (TIGR03000 family)